MCLHTVSKYSLESLLVEQVDANLGKSQVKQKTRFSQPYVFGCCVYFYVYQVNTLDHQPSSRWLGLCVILSYGLCENGHANKLFTLAGKTTAVVDAVMAG